MKIHIVNYEEALGIDGILSKYAYSMQKELQKLGYKTTVSATPDERADVNHHINYQSYVYKKGTKNTLQITHITDDQKFETLREGMETADKGICLSHETERQLKQRGLRRITTVLPAHDAIERRPLAIGIFTNVYPSGCKREHMFVELLKTIDTKKFHFLIMGKGWENIVSKFREKGIMYEYHPEFEPSMYKTFLYISDYCLYLGEDEGSMGVLDAKYAGIRIIAPNVGFHKELKVDYPFKSQNELNDIFKRIVRTPVDDWTWENYVKAHVRIWKSL